MARTTITKEFKFSMGHSLWLYEGKCFQLHGHNYKCLVGVSRDATNLTSVGFVMDFGDLKERIANVVDGEWDHKTLVNEEDPRFDRLGEEQMKELGIIKVPWNPTAENMAAAIFAMCVDRLEQEFEVLTEYVTLWETDTSYATVSRR